MHSRISYFVNGITIWRILAAPLVIYLAFSHNLDLFKWFLALSFFTDAVDGYLARRYKVVSKRGAVLDSVGDDLTVLAGIIGIFVFKLDFIRDQLPLILVMTFFFILQVSLALIRYRKMSAFHTWLAKIAAVLQGVFLLLLFFLPHPLYFLFYLAASVTILDLTEETALVLLLPEWKENVKGLFWVLKTKRNRKDRTR
ncbi:MAG: CDP-alcohol phosphatidyltransferase family protein [Bacteroidota bacterium]|nr:CDP-alcohol phosphatidyltransferase family protein [Bacteroidota bacterium]MDP4215601.1 CDP-alcohol phosphatidyltransferase family protein [Bacteroidota bacterium]MDP4246150.1 CDP-alcohol phosphatidyltransferase family protein [Bacteroidota bacterium]MDP4255966.1 CDP-alcohol phosphatidyltransferase family protein [Bacteroidota bacterium]MDP4259549.1 CDP-alcohol phosphatidyltransferase family protein [Bacteroidota bacterium]